MSCVGLAFSEQGIQQFFHVIPFLSAWDADLRRIRRRISSLLLYAMSGCLSIMPVKLKRPPVPNRGAADRLKPFPLDQKREVRLLMPITREIRNTAAPSTFWIMLFLYWPITRLRLVTRQG